MQNSIHHRASWSVERLHSAALFATFIATVFLSAALIFVVQPMFTRFVLPRLGGSPAVWSVAMAFFQAVLFAGYLYAHMLSRIASLRVSVNLHLTVTACALAWLPLGIAAGWGEPPQEAESLWLLGLFAASIGVPYFALSANGPLLQAWFVRANHGERDPYYLYAVSNAGSFIALLAYPVAIEPLLTLASQSRLWTVGYMMLILMIAICGALTWSRASGRTAAETVSAGSSVPIGDDQPGLSELGRWTALAAIPTALLVAVTAQISTDIAAIPLVWIVPLALYLMTLVIVFRSWSETKHRTVVSAVPWGLLALAFVLVVVPESNLEGFRFIGELGLHLVVFSLVAFMCHGELARRRPDPSQLTTFYLAMSFGGMVGGVLAGMVAPNVFSWVAEYPLLLIAAALCIPAGRVPNWATSSRLLAAVAIAAALIIVPHLLGQSWLLQAPLVKASVCLAFLIAGMIMRGSPMALAAMLVLALLAGWLYPPEGSTTTTFRSFFGVHKVHESEDGRYRLLLHGTTVHGAQRIRTEKGEPEQGKPEPLTYYRVGSPIHSALTAARTRKGGPIRIAAVGLGAGSMACLVEPQDQLTYFEIDPIVIKIARDPKLFNFISACRPDLPIVVGDARLTLARAEPGSFDAIVIDAFASDAIPTHLLTREALKLYASKLAPGGIIALHLSNRHMELTSVAHAIAATSGFVSRGIDEDIDEEESAEYKFESTVVAIAREARDLEALEADDDWEAPTAEQLAVTPWTDDYANPLGAMWRHKR